MSQPDTEEILEVCGKVGEIMLNAGAETSRIETTVEYIGHAAGAKGHSETSLLCLAICKSC